MEFNLWPKMVNKMYAWNDEKQDNHLEGVLKDTVITRKL